VFTNITDVQGVLCALEQSSIISITDDKGFFTYVSPSFCNISKYSEEELLGKLHPVFGSDIHSDIYFKEMWRTIRQGKVWKGEVHIRAKDDAEYWMDASIIPFLDDQEERYRFIAIQTDITERKKAEKMIYQMAHFDPLTQLPNRTLFQDKLADALEDAKRSGNQIGVMFIDLDRFKKINDTLGHSTGDILLKEVAKRLSGCLRSDDCVSRLGGDEFVVFLNRTTRKEAEKIAQRLIVSISNPVLMEHLELCVTPSIGISMYPDDAEHMELLLRNADAAMYLAKEKGRDNFQFFTEKLHQTLAKKLKLESELRKALDRDQFTLYYQPKINLGTGRIMGMEALIRWQHPELGLVPPNQFLPLAEESGLIVPIGEWVIRTACKQAKAWHEAGHLHLTMAINLSLRQFMQNNLTDMIAGILRETGLAPALLEVEITEGMAIDVNYTMRVLERLKSLGVSISIDDFGRGFNSLSSLGQFPIDRLKIDQSFFHNLNRSNQVIVKTIIDMAYTMNIDVIAEGVETQEHVDFLKGQKCMELQGYFYSKPLPQEEADALILRGVTF